MCVCVWDRELVLNRWDERSGLLVRNADSLPVGAQWESRLREGESFEGGRERER